MPNVKCKICGKSFYAKPFYQRHGNFEYRHYMYICSLQIQGDSISRIRSEATHALRVPEFESLRIHCAMDNSNPVVPQVRQIKAI